MDTTRDGLVAGVDALPAAAVAPMPGWITGQPLEEQGVETTMPNLPDMVLPATDAAPFEVRVRAVADDAVRLVIAPPGSPPLDDDGTWLGIVVDPTAGGGTGAPADVRVDDDAAVLETGRVRVRLTRAPFSVEVTDTASGQVLLRTAERVRQVAGFPLAPAVLVEGGTTTLHLELAPTRASPASASSSAPWSRTASGCGCGWRTPWAPGPGWPTSRCRCGTPAAGGPASSTPGRWSPPTSGRCAPRCSAWPSPTRRSTCT